jgi:putative Mg2+ transporter-C (MgtC) family protein
MPLHLTWANLAVRLCCTLIAGVIIGYNRGESGKTAGLRTTVLVCLAAAVAMLQVNYLLPLAGRSSDSFVMNDLMRLPLGILTGVGFIGAGAIMRRREIVVGVTTAATLWYVTVIGLSFGGGQYLLGWVATALGCLVLWGLKWPEKVMATEHYAKLSVTVEQSGPKESVIRQHLRNGSMVVLDANLAIDGQMRRYNLDVREVRRTMDNAIPDVIEELGRLPGVSSLHWRRFG